MATTRKKAAKKMGRPKKLPSDATPITTWVSDQTIASLDALAAQRSIAEGRVVSRSDVIRDILQRAVEG